jgi:lambda family phage portal protein
MSAAASGSAGACPLREELRQAVAKALKPNVIDRAVAVFSPRRAAERVQARAAVAWGGYTGARWDRKATKAWAAARGDADAVTNSYDLATLRDRSRDLVRNEPLGRGALSTVVSKVVGTGLTLQSRPDGQALKLTPDEAAALSNTIEREFGLWAESTDCDITRAQTFAGITELFFWSVLESGDCFALTPMVKRKGAVYSTCLQLVEADRVCNPLTQTSDTRNFRQGIELDDNGAPLRYHIRHQHPQGYPGIADASESIVEAFGARTGRRNVIHGFRRERPGQTRGVPYLAPVIETLKQLGRYTDAEVDAAVLSAMFTVFVTTPGAEGFAPDMSDAAGHEPGGGGFGGGALNPQSEVRLGSGSIIDLLPGEKPEFANPTRPNANFDPFIQALTRQIGIALGVPYEVLIKHFTASYSAARAALLEAWEFFKNRRAWLVSAFVQPAFEVWFDEAVQMGRISVPGYFADPAIRRACTKAEWIGPQPQSLDPEKDANAAMTRLQIGVGTLEDETLTLTGKSYDEQHAQQVREREMRLRDGLSVLGAPPPPGTPTPGTPAPNNPDGTDNPDQPDQTDQPEKPDGNRTRRRNGAEVHA